jgi:hypothetical protein
VCVCARARMQERMDVCTCVALWGNAGLEEGVEGILVFIYVMQQSSTSPPMMVLTLPTLEHVVADSHF